MNIKITEKPIKLIYVLELFIFSIVVVYGSFYALFMRAPNIDEYEHLYSSFLVYKGQVPYRDFFEHHHPLLWYVFSPMLLFFYNSAYIWVVLRVFSALMLIGECYFLIKICQQISSNKLFHLFAVLFFLASDCILFRGTEFRPDNLMLLFFLAGIYYWFCFLKYRWQSALNLSFFCFFLSVMALQKVLISLLPVILVCLFLLVRKKMSWNAIGVSIILPIIWLSGYVAFLFYTDSYQEYFECNWLLNLKQKFAFKHPMVTDIYFRCCFLCSIYLICFFRNNLLKIIIFLELGTCALLQLVYTPWHQYWLPVYPYFAIILAFCVTRWKNKVFLFLLSSGVIVYMCIQVVKLVEHMKAVDGELKLRVFLTEKVLEFSQPNDLIISNRISGGIRQNMMGYYWFGREYVASLHHYYFPRHEWPDLEKIIKTRRPKIINDDDTELNCFTDNQIFSFDLCVATNRFEDKDFVEQNYHNYGFIYVRKY